MTTYWRTLGQGARPCLALHCSLAHSGAWRDIADGLGDALTLHAIDFPGHGKSSGDPSAEDHVEQAIAAAAERLTEPMDILAHSFGAYVALRLAMAHPDKVRSLSLYEPVYMASVRESHPALHAQNASEMRQVSAWIDEGNRTDAARFFMRIWGDGSKWADLDPLQQSYFEERITQPCRIQPWVSDDVTRSLAELANIDVPVLLMTGTRSPEIMEHVQNSLAGRISDAQCLTIVGATHMGLITHAKDCAEAIAQHLNLR